MKVFVAVVAFVAAGLAPTTGLAQSAEHDALVGSDRVYGFIKDAKIITDAKDRTVSLVQFDIALAAAESKDTKGGIGVFLGSVGLGSHGASHGETSSYSRIKFSVPVVLPGEGRVD